MYLEVEARAPAAARVVAVALVADADDVVVDLPPRRAMRGRQSEREEGEARERKERMACYDRGSPSRGKKRRRHGWWWHDGARRVRVGRQVAWCEARAGWGDMGGMVRGACGLGWHGWHGGTHLDVGDAAARLAADGDAHSDPERVVARGGRGGRRPRGQAAGGSGILVCETVATHRWIGGGGCGGCAPRPPRARAPRALLTGR